MLVDVDVVDQALEVAKDSVAVVVVVVAMVMIMMISADGARLVKAGDSVVVAVVVATADDVVAVNYSSPFGVLRLDWSSEKACRISLCGPNNLDDHRKKATATLVVLEYSKQSTSLD